MLHGLTLIPVRVHAQLRVDPPSELSVIACLVEGEQQVVEGTGRSLAEQTASTCPGVGVQSEPVCGSIQVCRRVLGTFAGRSRRGLLQLRRRVLVRRGHAQRKVQRTLLGIVDEVGQSPVELEPLRAAGRAVDRGGEERMREANPVALHNQDSGRLRLVERVRRDTHGVHGRPRQGGSHERSLARGGRERVQTTGDEVVERRGDRKRPAAIMHVSERAADLQREERVAAGGLRDPDERGPGRRRTEVRSEQVVQRAKRQRADLGPEDRIPPQPERRFDARPPCEQQPHSSGQAARGELEPARRSPVEPLHVVDRDDERLTLRERREQGDERAADRALVCTAAAPEQRRFERTLLWLRELVAAFVIGHSNEVGERGIRQHRLALSRLRAQHPVAAALSCGNALEPKRGLADARLALKQQRIRLVRFPGEEVVDRGELGVAADDRCTRRDHLRRLSLSRT